VVVLFPQKATTVFLVNEKNLQNALPKILPMNNHGCAAIYKLSY
jgi:hypothetical protein